MLKQILFILLLVFTSTNYSFADTFTDVLEDDYFYDAVEYLKSNDIVQGYQDGSFGVDRSISRAELSKIIILDSNYPLKKSTKCFLDVGFSDWFSPHVCTAKAYGIVNGFDGGYFKPNNSITKAESLKLILLSKKISDFESSLNFDSGINMSESDWFYDIVNFAKKNQIWFFDSNDSPNELISRAEFAELFFRTVNFVNPESSLISEFNKDALDADTFENPLEDLNVEELKKSLEDANTSQDDTNDLLVKDNFLDLEDATGISVDNQNQNQDNNGDNIAFNPSDELLNFNFTTYDVDSFDKVELINEFSNFYFRNQIVSFNGMLDSNDDSILFAVLDQNKETVYSEVFPVFSKRFEIDVLLDFEGDYYFALIPGTKGTSKIYDVKILDIDNFKLQNNNRDDVNLEFITEFADDLTSAELKSNDLALYELSFSQGQNSFSYLINSNNEFVIDYKSFVDFIPGKIELKASRLDVDFENFTINKFNDFDLLELDAEYHNFSEISDDITNLNLDNFYTLNSPVTVSFDYNGDFSKDFYLINPNGSVNVFKDQILSQGNTHSLTFKPNESGTYVLEVNDLNGLAIINTPIYQEGKDILLPDYFDLFDSKDIGVKVDLNLMLNLINEVRTNFNLSQVSIDPSLSQLASDHMLDMVENNFFAHVNLEGQTPQQRATQAGINTLVGENLAKDLNTEKAFYSLMRSAAHRKNILNPSWDKVGLAIAESDGYVYAVQEFSFSEDSVLNAFNELVQDKLNVNSQSQNLILRADYWTDLMSENQNFSTTINGESIFDNLNDSGFSSFLALVGAQSDIANLEANLIESLNNLSDFEPESYAVSVNFDGTGKYAFSIIVAK